MVIMKQKLLCVPNWTVKEIQLDMGTYEWDPSASCLNWSMKTVRITTCLGLYAHTFPCLTQDCAPWIVLLTTGGQIPEQSILWCSGMGVWLPDSPHSQADTSDCSLLLLSTCHTCAPENKELGDSLQCRSPQRWKIVSSNWVQWAVSSWQGFKWPFSSEGALDLSSMQMRLMKLFNLKTRWQLSVLSSSQNCVRVQHKCGTAMHMYIHDYTNQFLLLECNENEKRNKKYLEVIFLCCAAWLHNPSLCTLGKPRHCCWINMEVDSKSIVNSSPSVGTGV